MKALAIVTRGGFKMGQPRLGDLPGRGAACERLTSTLRKRCRRLLGQYCPQSYPQVNCRFPTSAYSPPHGLLRGWGIYGSAQQSPGYYRPTNSRRAALTIGERERWQVRKGLDEADGGTRLQTGSTSERLCDLRGSGNRSALTTQHQAENDA